MHKSMLGKTSNAILNDYITNGAFNVGERLPTIRELHSKYGASVGTIAHALSSLAIQGIVEKRSDGGYYVAKGLESIEQSKPDMLGYIVPTMKGTEIIPRIHAGIESVCTRKGYNVLSATTNHDYELEIAQVTKFIEIGCKGIVLFPVSRTRSQLTNDYLKTEFKDFPIVLVDMAYPEQQRTQVLFDNYNAGYTMTQLLIDEGHTKIAFMRMDVNGIGFMHKSNADRLRGYQDALRENNIHENFLWTVGKINNTSTLEETTNHLVKWRDQANRPSAVIALEDNQAIFIISVCRELGINVPNDLRVVGFDDLFIGESITPPFPTTQPDFELMGATAARLVIQEAESQICLQSVYMLPVPLKPRVGMILDRNWPIAAEHSLQEM